MINIEKKIREDFFTTKLGKTFLLQNQDFVFQKKNLRSKKVKTIY